MIDICNDFEIDLADSL